MPVSTVRQRSHTYRGIYFRVRADGSKTYSVYWKGTFVPAGETETEAVKKQAFLRDQDAKGKNTRPTKVTFGKYAEEWVERRRREVDARTIEYWQWCLGHLLPFFEDVKLSRLSVVSVKDYMLEKQTEGKLSPSSINKTLKMLAQILDEAIDDGHLAENPAQGKKRRLKAGKPKRTWLELEQAHALLAAAGKHRALLATMMLAGLRVSELIALRWRDVDLAAGRLRVTDSKTEAGVRVVDVYPALLDDLKVHKLDSVRTAPEDLVFGTVRGTMRNRSNITRQILQPAIDKANAELLKAGRLSMEGVTNHSLRRTFCALLFEDDQTPRYVMGQMGHTDAKLALEVYAKVLDEQKAPDFKQRLNELLRGADLEAPETALTNSAVNAYQE